MSKELELPDYPLTEKDFQESAIKIGYRQSDGTKFFRDINLRGRLYEIAIARHNNQELTDSQQNLLSNYPSTYTDIYYLHEDAPKATISLNGLRRLINKDVLRQVVDLNSSYTERRVELLGIVIAENMMKQYSDSLVE